MKVLIFLLLIFKFHVSADNYQLLKSVSSDLLKVKMTLKQSLTYFPENVYRYEILRLLNKIEIMSGKLQYLNNSSNYFVRVKEEENSESQKSLEKSVEGLLIGSTELFVAGVTTMQGNYMTAAGLTVDAIARLKSSYNDFCEALQQKENEVRDSEQENNSNYSSLPDETTEREY